MSTSENEDAPPKVWSLEQAALWIETRTGVPRHPIRRRLTPTTMQELHRALRAGTITASGCVDGGERRTISPEEWSDYRLNLRRAVFHDYMRSSQALITVLSIRSFPAAALKYHGYRSRVRVPSARSSDGEPAYHRVITDVLVRRHEVMQEWPEEGRAVSTDHPQRVPSRSKSSPSRDRARIAMNELYPKSIPNQAIEPNALLCRRVSQKLKEMGLASISNDTILREAARRK
jgi:hypothetical protein